MRHYILADQDGVARRPSRRVTLIGTVCATPIRRADESFELATIKVVTCSDAHDKSTLVAGVLTIAPPLRLFNRHIGLPVLTCRTKPNLFDTAKSEWAHP